MFDLGLGIGHSGGFSPEYHDSKCLAGLDIRPGYSGSISSWRAERQKTGTPNVEGLG
jgi:hypothetical protein